MSMIMQRSLSFEELAFLDRLSSQEPELLLQPTSEFRNSAGDKHDGNTALNSDRSSLELDGLTLERRGLLLLDRSTLTVSPGETLAVMGPSGAGKTTLLRTMAGLTPTASGTVKRPSGRVAMVFQDPRLLPWRSALKNVELVLPKAQRHKAREWLDRVGLADASHLYPIALSGGMRQRVAIARALACDASLVLVDEPFASLDAETAERLRTMLTDELGQLDRPVVWVTHNATEAGLVASKILEMNGPPDGTWKVSPAIAR